MRGGVASTKISNCTTLSLTQRRACQSLGMIIVDVDYRLAPECPYPTQIWDAWAALKWVFVNAASLGIDSSRVSVGGLSAGGHLAGECFLCLAQPCLCMPTTPLAVLAILARDEEGMPPLRLQLLVVPAVDARSAPIEGSCDPKTVPYETYFSCEHAPCLPLNRMRWFSNLWLGRDPGLFNRTIFIWCPLTC